MSLATLPALEPKMLERFIADYSDEAFQFAFHLCGNVEEAKELVQEAFYRLIARWDSFDQSQPVENFFYILLRNLYYDSLKTYDRRNCVSLDAESSDFEDGRGSYADNVEDERDEHILERLEKQEFSDQVQQALGTLGKEHRALIVMADVEQLSYEQMGSVLDSSVSAIRGKLCRARKAFRRALIERSLAEPEPHDRSEEVMES